MKELQYNTVGKKPSENGDKWLEALNRYRGFIQRPNSIREKAHSETLTMCPQGWTGARALRNDENRVCRHA